MQSEQRHSLDFSYNSLLCVPGRDCKLSLRINAAWCAGVICERPGCGGSRDCNVPVDFTGMSWAILRAAGYGSRAGMDSREGDQKRQHSCAISTCIASNVLSKRAWNAALPRFGKRSSPKSNFINL